MKTECLIADVTAIRSSARAELIFEVDFGHILPSWVLFAAVRSSASPESDILVYFWHYLSKLGYFCGRGATL